MKLLIHPKAGQQLDQLVISPGGSFLLHGADGVGKRTVAMDVARRINCQGCEDASCRSCRMAMAGNHPDVTLIVPDEKGKIGIEAIQALDHQLHYRQYEAGSRRVVIIAGAETMTIPAQNALLKTPEEPPVGSTMILTATSPVAVLETIVSRCRLVYLPPVEHRLVEDMLVELGNDTESAVRIAATAYGRPGVAISLAGDQDTLVRHQEALEAADGLLQGQRLFDRLIAAADIASQSKELDAYIAALTERARVLSRSGQQGMLPAVERLRQRLAANVNPKVALEALAVEVAC